MLPVSRFRIEDKSMEPFLKSGDYVFVNKLAYVLKMPDEGDVIVFKNSNKFLVKRVTKVYYDKIFVEGDNILSKKIKSINKNSVVGKVILKISDRPNVK
ncbi:MAG: signal peptidase I [Candidatus Aenigmarchaeota archaeon]|nr:signal peptidase I [Candidatus Aenigmarchaeota archaeon]